MQLTRAMQIFSGAALAGILATATPADATEKCRLALVKQSAKITQTTAKLIQKCEEGVRIGKRVGPCPDAETAAKLADAKATTVALVAKVCATSVGEFNHGSCPNAQGPNGTATCGQILVTSKAAEGECVACLAEEHAQEINETAYGAFADAGDDRRLAKCQAAIGKRTTAFFVARSKILAACQSRIVAGEHQGPCPDGHQKAVAALAKAEAKVRTAICKACGGGDEECGGGDDVTPSAIGFPSLCPRLQVDHGDGAVVTNLSDVVACLVERAVQRTQCTDAQALPGDGNAFGQLGHCEAAATSCHPDGGDATVRVAITNASGRDLAGVGISLGYRGVGIPGTGEVAGDAVTNLQSGFMVSGDSEASLTVGMVTLDGLADGPLFDVAVRTCADADAFGCVVRNAADTDGNEILEHLTCTATVL